jgi:hypothetical protein
MSNVERLSVDKDTADLLLNKFQRHRGDTLNSGMCCLLNSHGSLQIQETQAEKNLYEVGLSW